MPAFFVRSEPDLSLVQLQAVRLRFSREVV